MKFGSELRVRELIKLIAEEKDPEKLKVLAAELELLIATEGLSKDMPWCD